MRKLIQDVVNFPNGCETVRFTTCFVSMLMRAEGIVDPNHAFFCGSQERGDCVSCGECAGLLPIHKKHKELYNLYTAVTGFGFLQIDLTNDDHMGDSWNQTCNVMLRAHDWYIGFAMDYAGYEYVEWVFPKEPKARVFGEITASIDKDIPVLALFARKYQWVLITGYDDDGVLYGLDGSLGYWGKPEPEPAGYDESGLFVMPDWYEKAGHAFVLGAKKEASVTIQDVFRRGAGIMEAMMRERYYDRSADFMANDANFDTLDDERLLEVRDRIAGWIGQPIDQRAMLGRAVNTLRAGNAPDREMAAYREINELCRQTHDGLTDAWSAIGEYKGGDRIKWARVLKNKATRRMLADCFRRVCDRDERILENLRKGFAQG